MLNGHWKTDCDMTAAKAFVYLVTFTELDLYYIGAKKVIDVHGKETNWKRYKTSSKKVRALLDAGHTADFDIIDVHCSWDGALNCEDELLRANNVLYDDMWLNESYGGRGGAFSGKKHTPEAIERTVAGSTGLKRADATLKKMSIAQKARTDRKKHTQAAKDKISEKMRGRVRSTNTIEKWRAAQTYPMYSTPDGIMTSTVAAQYYNCSKQTIISRCDSTKPKWVQWFKISSS